MTSKNSITHSTFTAVSKQNESVTRPADWQHRRSSFPGRKSNRMWRYFHTSDTRGLTGGASHLEGGDVTWSPLAVSRSRSTGFGLDRATITISVFFFLGGGGRGGCQREGGHSLVRRGFIGMSLIILDWWNIYRKFLAFFLPPKKYFMGFSNQFDLIHLKLMVVYTWTRGWVFFSPR